jgi:methylase of polypeptide subunit release factors
MVAKETPRKRKFIIEKKRKRRKKIKKLIEKLKSINKEERERIIDKILRISPHYPVENISKKLKENSFEKK